LYLKITQIRRTTATIQFVEMTYTGSFAGADHPHVENWWASVRPPMRPTSFRSTRTAGSERRGRRWPITGSWDGHAESLRFRDVFQSIQKNKFDPAIAASDTRAAARQTHKKRVPHGQAKSQAYFRCGDAGRIIDGNHQRACPIHLWRIQRYSANRCVEIRSPETRT